MYKNNKNYKLIINHLIIVFLISFSIRMFLSSPPSINTTGDGAEYLNLAKHLYKENSFSYDGKTSNFFRPPLYPFIISIVFKMTGVNMKAIFFLNIFLNSLIPIIFFMISLHLKIKYSLSFLLSIFISFFNIFISSSILTENLYNTLLLLSIYLILLTRKSKRIEFIFWTGVVIGLTVLTRPIALMLLPAILITFRNPRFFLIISISTFLTISPWIIRNSMINGSPTLIDNNFGYNLYVGNNPYKNFPPKFDIIFFQTVKQISEDRILNNKKLRKFSLKFIINNPLLFIQKIPYKIDNLFGAGIKDISEFKKIRGDYIKNSTILLFFINWIIPAILSLLFFFYLPFAIKSDKDFNFFVILIFMFIIIHSIFFGMPRYREPLIPLMLITIISGAYKYDKKEKIRRALALLISLILFYYNLLTLNLFWF